MKPSREEEEERMKVRRFRLNISQKNPLMQDGKSQQVSLQPLSDWLRPFAATS